MDICNICRELLTESKENDGVCKELKVTVCGHSFHKECIDGWINFKIGKNEKSTCPICRVLLVDNDNDDNDDDDNDNDNDDNDDDDNDDNDEEKAYEIKLSNEEKEIAEAIELSLQQNTKPLWSIDDDIRYYANKEDFQTVEELINIKNNT
jgi:hypothetical protein